MAGIRAVALAIRFVLELAAFAALAYGESVAGGLALAIAAPVVAIAVWGVFVAPKRRVVLPEPARWAIELLVFAAASAALVVSGLALLGAVLFVVAVADGAVVRAGHQGSPDP